MDLLLINSSNWSVTKWCLIPFQRQGGGNEVLSSNPKVASIVTLSTQTDPLSVKVFHPGFKSSKAVVSHPSFKSSENTAFHPGFESSRLGGPDPVFKSRRLGVVSHSNFQSPNVGVYHPGFESSTVTRPHPSFESSKSASSNLCFEFSKEKTAGHQELVPQGETVKNLAF